MNYKYYIGELGFKTKKESHAYTKNIITSLGYCEIKKKHKDFNFFVNLINNHQNKKEKIGCGIKSFIIKKNIKNPRAYAMDIKRKDNSIIDFSWKSCAEQTFKTEKHDLISALRYSIEDQILNFKNKTKKICKNCNKINTLFDVDHDNPSFYTLSNNFLNNYDTLPKEFDEDILTNQRKFKSIDKDFELAWYDYHKNNCNLQILCHDCNLRKKK